MEKFNFTFTEADLNLLTPPTQAELDALYVGIRAYAVGHDAETGDLVGGLVPDGARFPDSHRMELRIHPWPRMDPEARLRHCATLNVDVPHDDGHGASTQTYKLCYKEDSRQQSGVRYELWRDGALCDGETVRAFLRLLSPDTAETNDSTAASSSDAM